MERISGNPMYPNEVHKWVALDDNSLVSMNMWGFRPDIFNEMQAAFDKFIDDKIQVVLRINDMIRKGIYPSKLF